MFFFGMGMIWLCQQIGLGEIATMLITIPSAAAIGAATAYLLGGALSS
jgi:hypothetical protein